MERGWRDEERISEREKAEREMEREWRDEERISEREKAVRDGKRVER